MKQSRIDRRTFFLLFLLAALVLVSGGLLLRLVKESAAANAAQQNPESTISQLTYSDFMAYWSSFQLLIQKKNMYDFGEVSRLESSLGKPGADALMMWNPPWTVLLLAPVLSLPYPLAVVAWLFINLAMLFLTATLAWKLRPNDDKQLSPVVLILAALFMPAIDAMRWGQLSVLIACATVGVWWAFERGKHVLAGMLLVILTIKPHCVYLMLLLLADRIFRERSFKVVISFLVTLSLFIAGLYVFDSSPMTHWFGALNVDPTQSYVFRTVDYYTPTLVMLIRASIFKINGTLVTWPIAVIPVLSVLGAGFYLLRMRRLTHLELLPAFLALSSFLAPHGWFHDQTVLLIADLLILSNILRLQSAVRRRVGLLLYGGIRVLTICPPFAGMHGEHFFVWLPLSLFALWYFFNEESKRKSVQPCLK